MKTNFLSILFCLAIGLFQSCSTSDNEVLPTTNAIQRVHDRVAFKTEDDAIETLAMLTNFSDKQLLDWENVNNRQSLRRAIDASALAQDSANAYFNPALAAILNTRKEYQAGNNIIWFYNNYVFKIPNANESVLAKVQADPENQEFLSLRETFVSRQRGRESKAGFLILSQNNMSPPFKLFGDADFRFIWHLLYVYSGVNRSIQLQNCLQYLRASNGNWYLAGDVVKFRSITNTGFVRDGNFTGSWTPNTVTSASKSNANGYLYYIVGTSNQDPAGKVYATFRGEVVSSLGTFSFVENVEWY